MKQLSKSIFIMFMFDLVVFLGVTYIVFSQSAMPDSYLFMTVLLVVCTGLITNALKSSYCIREFNVTLKNFYLLFEGVIFSQIPAGIFLLLSHVPNKVALPLVCLNLVTIYLILLTYRILFHFYLFYVKRAKNVLIIGTNKEGKLIADEIIRKKALRMNVVGFVSNDSQDEFIGNDNTSFVARFNELGNIVKDKSVDIVIIALRQRFDGDFLTNIINNVPYNVKIYSMADFYELVTGKYYIDRIAVNRLFFTVMHRRSLVYELCKRAYDIIAASIILTVTSPILLYIGIRVKLTDGDSPIYTQTRIGRNGKPFKMYKLRTMYKNDYVPKNGNIDEETAGINDNRVIPFCRFVRKARFDEIPQMINILKGDMSIVGPRAEWDDLVKIYSQNIDYYKCREWVKTGWTGWAQINQGHCVTEDDITEKLQYDLYYLKHRNILWEIGILIKAVFLALGGRHD